MQLAPFAYQQCALQLIFQMAQHFADGGLGNKQLLGRAGETLLADHFHKITQGADIHFGLS
ncbi:hypothetical protein D3C76_1116520 [compost metagenome]